LTYYGYFGRLRAEQINTIAASIVTIDELTARIGSEDAKLGSVESGLKVRAGELESAQKKRERVMVSLDREFAGRAANLKNLQAEREQMEALLSRLIREAEANPFHSTSPFAKSRGKLAWPVAGRIVTGFGKNGGVRSDGLQIDAQRGSEVRAVREGRVLWADYMNGRGNVIIVDHDDGYWTLYAHNENLFKVAGAKVAAGEKIATVGDTGGRPRPGLYFEIRKGSKPVDPQGWFLSNAPPAH
jgi:septal ring factor EnvC (AmiA/AmiB activator)